MINLPQPISDADYARKNQNHEHEREASEAKEKTILGGILRRESWRIGIVKSRFNLTVCDGLTDSCTKALEQLGIASKSKAVQLVQLVTVPGALEIPLALQKLAQSKQFDTLIALGAVIRGETYHFELVANQSAAGILRISLDFGIPIANGVLTTDTEEQAMARISEKGRAAAHAAIEMANTCAVLESVLGEEIA